MNKYFFDIPVYRLSEEKYIIEENKKSENYYREVYLKNGAVASLTTYEQFLRNSCVFRDIWRYNEIIGFIRLYFSGNQIRGEYYQHNVQKIYKTRRKNFAYKTHKIAVEISISYQSDSEIYKSILNYLQKCELELKKRYIDIENFKITGQHVQWNKLLNKKVEDLA